MKHTALRYVGVLCLVLVGCHAQRPDAPQADLLIHNGVIYDGSGAAPVHGDVAVRGDRIAAVGDLSRWNAARVVDAQGLAVSPGFINMMCWSTETLIEDGRGLSDLVQGATLGVMGEGFSMGPLTPAMKAELVKQQVDIHYEVSWTTLNEYLEFLQRRGISMNVASYVGAATVRTHELGEANRAPTPEELARMKQLVAQAMEEGALGVASALIYAPGSYATTDELIALAQEAGKYGGGYASHLRSEGNRFLEALDEFLRIAKAGGGHAEVYHLKAAGRSNWPKMQQAITRIEQAREAGLDVSADMYTYPAGATGLDTTMPPWVQEGGLDQWVERLKKPEIRARVIKEMRTPSNDWENLLLAAGGADGVLLLAFKEEKLKPLTGKTLGEVARLRGTSAEETAMDLVIEDHTRVSTAFFLMSEENVKLGLSQPWVSLNSDAESSAPEGVFLKSSAHPRAYGNFARFLAKYVREEKVATLADAIRRMTQLPAQNLRLTDRGCLKAGCYADIVIFDPATIQDHATFAKPLQLATGVRDVFVNGVQALKDGKATAARPGRVVRGPGYKASQ